MVYRGMVLFNYYLRSHTYKSLKWTVSSTPWGVLETVFTNHLDLIKNMTTLVWSQLAAPPNFVVIYIKSRWYNKLPTMLFTSSKDTLFGNCYFDISQTETRLVRATLKTYERTGTYVFLKLLKKAAEDYEFEQRISLTLEEFGNLVKKAEKIREAAATQDSKPPPAKKQKFDQCSRGGGSNVWVLSQLFQTISKAVQIFNCWWKAKLNSFE